MDKLESNLNLISDINNYKHYGNWLTKEEVMSIVSPSEYEREFVKNWFSSNGFNVLYDYGDALKLSGKVSELEKVFRFKYWRTSYRIPKKIRSFIQFIDGLSNPPVHKIRTIFPKHNSFKYGDKNYLKDSVPAQGYVNREVISRIYNIPKNLMTGKRGRQNVALMEYQSPGFSKDGYFINTILNEVSPVNITVIGSDYGPGTESDLDVQIVGVIAENVSLTYYNTDGWLYPAVLGLINDSHWINATSTSYGWALDQQTRFCENCNSSEQYVDRINSEYLKLANMGVMQFVSSGDSGTSGRSSYCNVDRPVEAAFPGVSPYVTSVGATFLRDDPSGEFDYSTPFCYIYGCNNGTEQNLTTHDTVGWCSGSATGYYKSENLPNWQKDYLNDYYNSGVPLPNNFSRVSRATPDLVGLGHNFPVFENGQVMGVDGTSMSSPLMLGLFTLVNEVLLEHNCPRLGFLNPVIYKMKKESPQTFNALRWGNSWSTEMGDCPVRKDGGSNFGFMAGGKYLDFNLPFGLGSPNFDEIVKYLLSKCTAQKYEQMKESF